MLPTVGRPQTPLEQAKNWLGARLPYWIASVVRFIEGILLAVFRFLVQSVRDLINVFMGRY